METNKVRWLFPTPIMEFNLAHLTNSTVVDALMNMQPSYNNAVRGIRGARNPMELPELAPLYTAFQECVDVYSQEIGLVPNRVGSSWMNILRKGGSVDAHRHHESVVSGAFYPHVYPNSANLIFISPLDSYRMMDSVRQRFTGRNSPYINNAHHVSAETGKLVLFPSWLQHYVPQNESELRITISFNTQFV